MALAIRLLVRWRRGDCARIGHDVGRTPLGRLLRHRGCCTAWAAQPAVSRVLLLAAAIPIRSRAPAALAIFALVHARSPWRWRPPRSATPSPREGARAPRQRRRARGLGLLTWPSVRGTRWGPRAPCRTSSRPRAPGATGSAGPCDGSPRPARSCSRASPRPRDAPPGPRAADHQRPGRVLHARRPRDLDGATRSSRAMGRGPEPHRHLGSRPEGPVRRPDPGVATGAASHPAGFTFARAFNQIGTFPYLRRVPRLSRRDHRDRRSARRATAVRLDGAATSPRSRSPGHRAALHPLGGGGP